MCRFCQGDKVDKLMQNLKYEDKCDYEKYLNLMTFKSQQRNQALRRKILDLHKPGTMFVHPTLSSTFPRPFVLERSIYSKKLASPVEVFFKQRKHRSVWP